ncbi:MAG: enoyl-CoA hydratase/isomerase family protein [Syntrophomonadaceae bacterium]|jgi:2-(1,2-epoxy-1,2-dihydrophenyl)acetyl-CoA isomerase|nr:enoyl-CoA hydratase/isomerase family protein [Syntrophomonadaceae bacterium]
MNYDNIIFNAADDGIATITFNRPQQYNSFSEKTCSEFINCLSDIDRNQDIKVMIITGSGNAFSAGGDVNWLLTADTTWKKNMILEAAVKIIETLNNIKKPVICAVNGVAAGAGVAVLMASDIVIASTEAKFAPNFIKLGLVPDTGSSYYLVRSVGARKALELFWTGKELSADEAMALGIFNYVVPGDQLMTEANKFARRLIKHNYQSNLMIKELVRTSITNDLSSQCRLENYCQILAWSSQEFIDAMSAFTGKHQKGLESK